MKTFTVLDHEDSLDRADSCLILDCGHFPDIHHVMARGSGAGDHKSNCVSLCRAHHTEIHNLGRSTFADRYVEFKEWLIQNGWEFYKIGTDKKWFLPEKLLKEVLKAEHH